MKRTVSAAVASLALVLLPTVAMAENTKPATEWDARREGALDAYMETCKPDAGWIARFTIKRDLNHMPFVTDSALISVLLDTKHKMQSVLDETPHEAGCIGLHRMLSRDMHVQF